MLLSIDQIDCCTAVALLKNYPDGLFLNTFFRHPYSSIAPYSNDIVVADRLIYF